MQSLGKQGTPRPSSLVYNTNEEDEDIGDPPHPYKVTYCSSMDHHHGKEDVPPNPPHPNKCPISPQEIEEMAGVTRTADILVVAVGYPELVTDTWVKPGAVVLDVGINIIDNGDTSTMYDQGSSSLSYPESSAGLNTCTQPLDSTGSNSDSSGHPFHVVGDVNFALVSKKASAITPVPGGVGPMTIAALLSNTIHSAAWKLGVRLPGKTC